MAHTHADVQLAKLLFLDGKSVKEVQAHLPFVGATSLYAWKRETTLEHLKQDNDPVSVPNAENIQVRQNVLVVGDLHAPGNLEGYLQFCVDTYNKFN